MTIQLSTTFADALLAHDATAGQSAVADQIGGGTLVAYSGTAPAGPNEALSGNTALATFTFSAASAQGTPSAGVMNLAFAATTVTASATGTATFFRILSSGGTALVQGTIGTSGADWNMSSTSITSGDNVSITGTPTISWAVA
jgi:hypothetical protein